MQNERTTDTEYEISKDYKLNSLNNKFEYFLNYVKNYKKITNLQQNLYVMLNQHRIIYLANSFFLAK